MALQDFSQFFERTTGYPPYLYQNALGTTHDLPALLAVSTEGPDHVLKENLLKQ